jgi:hypothetical protein
MSSTGYDAVTGMYGAFDAESFCVLDLPSRADALTALQHLITLLAEFSFSQEIDLSAALAAILTAAIRPSLDLAPMFHVKAHMSGSGKSYLCELITAFAAARRSIPTTFPSADEECRKFLLAELLQSPATIEFDNLTSDLMPHNSLCTALTSEYLTGRILGLSKTASVNTRTLFISSGNNVGPVQDMARRCITIRLSPQIENPASRSFLRPNLVKEVWNERAHYVSAALTIVRAWVAADRPITDCKPLAGYGEWSNYCRQPLLWLGYPDPVGSMFEAVDEDPDKEVLSRVLEAWHIAFGNTPTRVRDAINPVLGNRQHGELQEVLHDIAGERGEINRRRLGRWIKRHEGRIVNPRKSSCPISWYDSSLKSLYISDHGRLT